MLLFYTTSEVYTNFGMVSMYFVYLKKKARNQGTNFPGDAEGGLCGVALILLPNMILARFGEQFC